MMSGYTRLNKAQLTQLCVDRHINIDDCQFKRDLIVKLQQKDMRGAGQEDVAEAEDPEVDNDNAQLADHLLDSGDESDPAEQMVGDEEEERTGESDSVTALRLQLKLAQTQLAQSQIELEREKIKTTHSVRMRPRPARQNYVT